MATRLLYGANGVTQALVWASPSCDPSSAIGHAQVHLNRGRAARVATLAGSGRRAAAAEGAAGEGSGVLAVVYY